jgi:hypothetical protein
LGTTTVTTKRLRFAGWHVWPPLKSDQETPLQGARVYFLGRVAALAPDVLQTLRAVDRDGLMDKDLDALSAWAARWQLAPWVVPYARETLRLWRSWPHWRGRTWSSNPADVSGELVPSTGRHAKRPTAIRVPARHFDWLVRAHVLRHHVEDIAIDNSGEAVDSGTVRRALRSLAIILDGKTPTKSRR